MTTNIQPLYQRLATLCDAIINCNNSGNTEWHQRHIERACSLVAHYMPSGSGFDNGTTLDFDLSHQNRLVFTTAFHHMDESGMYDGWTEHTVSISPSLTFGIKIAVHGSERNDILNYIAEVFDTALTERFDNDDVKQDQPEIEAVMSFNLSQPPAQAQEAG
jgi:hypothetical protein